MPKYKQHPRYNVLSFRVSDAELEEIQDAMIGGSSQLFLRDAALEKARSDNQAMVDMAIAKRMQQ